MSEAPKLQPPSPDTIDALVHIVGKKHAIRDEADMAPYLTEWRDRYRGKAAAVLKPGSTAEVSAILKCGNEVVVSLQRLTHVRDIDLASNTMTVEAGLTLGLAQQVAESAGRLFPLSLASEGSCQVGGVLATNAGGMA